MKNALILHGTGGNSRINWYLWLASELKIHGYEVWIPNLPQADKPNFDRYNNHILQNPDFKLTNQSLIVGHSSGAVAALGLLMDLPDGVTIDACYLIGAFKNDLGWKELEEFDIANLDFAKIKQKSRHFYFIHSDNDPYCPLDHAEYLSDQLGGELLIIPGQKHFSMGTMGETYRQFPYLLDLITQNHSS